MPMGALCPLGVKQERARHAGVVVPPAVAARRVLLESPQGEAVPPDRGDDLAEATRAFGEVTLAPVHEAVDAERDRMLFEQQEVATLPERRGDPAQPSVEVTHHRERAEPRVHEIEATAT